MGGSAGRALVLAGCIQRVRVQRTYGQYRPRASTHTGWLAGWQAGRARGHQKALLSSMHAHALCKACTGAALGQLVYLMHTS